MFEFDHVHILCSDIEAVGEFLHTVIGAEELHRNAALMNWEYQLSGTRIFVRQRRPDETLAAGDIRRAGTDHLGFRVPDIEAATARLVAAGCVVQTGPTRARVGLSTAFLMAPGGLLIELLQRS